jgi:nucleoside-diphosphate-sugar epimerase
MKYRVLITGSSGLIGTGVREALLSMGVEISGLDLKAFGSECGDVRDPGRVNAAIEGCDGILHLAAVSRVIWGERDPELCWATNVGGLRNVLDSARLRKNSPWVVFASSREVYGQPAMLPVTEDASLNPVNIYGRSKVEGERLVEEARRQGLRASVIRLSNVYGSTSDHEDRVVPAFARRASLGLPLHVEGADHTFDFTHIDDTARGIVAVIQYMKDGNAPPPPIHFLTGRHTSLLELAKMAKELAASESIIELTPPRSFDVSHFYGSPERARTLLGWRPNVSIREGLARLIDDFRSTLSAEDLHVEEAS